MRSLFRSLFLGRTQSVVQQFIRYVFVAGIAASADTACLYFLNHRFGINPLVAAAAGFLLGLLVNYWISTTWVFESTGRSGQEFALFAAIGVGGLAWTELILWVSVDVAHWSVMAAKALSLVLVLVWNFGMRKKFVFAV